MVDEESEKAAVLKVLRDKGPDFLLGMDIDRTWATGAQVFASPESVMIVFREQNHVIVNDRLPDFSIKNVASVVMPLDTARELHRILGEQIGAIDGSIGR